MRPPPRRSRQLSPPPTVPRSEARAVAAGQYRRRRSAALAAVHDGTAKTDGTAKGARKRPLQFSQHAKDGAASPTSIASHEPGRPCADHARSVAWAAAPSLTDESARPIRPSPPPDLKSGMKRGYLAAYEESLMNSKRLVSALAFALVTAGSSGYAIATDEEQDSHHRSDYRHPIVGMWITTFYIGPFYGPGTPVAGDVHIQQFSSDGNELINSKEFAPVLGNVCFGVWKALEDKTVKLRHIGWGYTPDNVFEGTGTIIAALTVSPDGDTYSGTYTSDYIDPNGVALAPPGAGDVRATRFKVEEASAEASAVEARAISEKRSSGRLSKRPGC